MNITRETSLAMLNMEIWIFAVSRQHLELRARAITKIKQFWKEDTDFLDLAEI